MSQVAKRYAEALFQVAKKQGTLAEVSADLNEVAKVFTNDTELVGLLAAPKLNAAAKKEMIKTLFSNANEAVVNTLQILIDKKRISDVAIVAEGFQALAAAAQGTAQATVYSTRPLTAEEQAEISASFGKLVGVEKLDITNEIDASLIGGVRVQIGNYIYDSTVASKLESLKRTLVG
ncbi:MAG: F0F1 ATP synthase subunit delta [Lysinibacillus sp.]